MADAVGDLWRFPYANGLIATRAPLRVLKKRRQTDRPCESCGRPGCAWVIFAYDRPGWNHWCAAWIVCDRCCPPEAETVKWHARGGVPGQWEPCGGDSCDH